MSYFCQIYYLYSQKPALYSQILYFYSNVFLFGSHCASNICGKVRVSYIWSVANESAHNVQTRGEGR